MALQRGALALLAGGLAAALLALPACALFETPTPQPRALVPWHGGPDAARPMRRVVLVPLHVEDGEPEATEIFASALRTAIAKRNLFETLPVSAEDLADVSIHTTREKGIFRTRDLVLLSERFGADGALHGVVTRFRATPVVQLGARLTLLDCRTGHVAWSSDFLLDGATASVDQDVHNYHDVWLREPGFVGGHRTILIAPRLFSAYAATRAVETLEKTLR